MDQGEDSNCYAYALAMVMTQALERKDKFVFRGFDKKKFIEDLVNYIVKKCTNGKKDRGYDVEKAMRKILPKFKMRYRNISENRAR